MPAELKQSFPATTNGLRAALEAIDQAGKAWSLNPDLVTRMQIIVEELFSNTIKYGYGMECGRPVRLHLLGGPPPRLAYEDEAPPFDLTSWKPPTASHDEVPVGQAGLALGLGLSSSVHYVARPQGNHIEIGFEPISPVA